MRFVAVILVTLLTFSCQPASVDAVVGTMSRLSSIASSSSSPSLVAATVPAATTVAETPSSSSSITISGGNFQMQDSSVLFLESSSNNVPINSHWATFIGEAGEIQEQKGRENKIMVIAVSHEITSPRDAATGLPTGRRQHRPIRMSVPVGTSTPGLYTNFVKGAILPSVTLGQYGSSNPKQAFDGTSPLIATTTYEQVSIASIERVGTTLELTMVYSRVKWTWGSVSYVDDWQGETA